MKDKKPIKIAIVGSAVAHSKSPIVHKKFAKQCGRRIHAELLQIQGVENEFYETMSYLTNSGFVGVTVAQPFKGLAFNFCNQLTERARYAGAVNTIRITADGRYIGDNTDGAGLVGDIKKNFNFLISGKKILLLGAGGAAHGLLKPLLDESPEKIVIVNRTVSRAIELSSKFDNTDVPIIVCSYGNLRGSFDLIINSTSASMENLLPGDLSKITISTHSLCYDLFYREEFRTKFELWAKELGVRSANGIGMVVEQGIVAFDFWTDTGDFLNTDSVIESFEFHRITQARNYCSLFFKPNSLINELNKQDLVDARHNSQEAQREYDKQFGLVPYVNPEKFL